MSHDTIIDALIFLAMAVVISPLCDRARVSPVLGYLVAGSVAGPAGLGLLADSDGTRGLAELGIVFLLFMIGLELSWERLKVIRHFIFGFGTAQVLATGGLAALCLAAAVGLPPKAALVVGLALAFSSTAFVLQILSERGEMNSQVGRVAVAVLIMQDLAVVPLLALVPLLGGEGSSVASAMGLALAKAVLAMATIFLVARFALRFLFRWVAATRAPESFIAAALFAVIGTGFATEALGLSYSLGAFLAGVMLASTEYRHQVEADLVPVRGLLMGLFFLTVGMSIDPAWLLGHWSGALIGVAALVAAKALVILILGLAFRFRLAQALHLGLLLAQGGEFVFVVLARAGEARLLDAATAEAVTVVVALSMAATPFLAALGDWVARRRRHAEAARLGPDDQTADLKDHIIIAGFGRVGQIVASVLKEQDIPFVAIDRDPRRVEMLRAQDLPIFFGDIRKAEMLRSIGAARARAVVLTISSGSGREKLVPRLRALFPDLKILVRAHDRRQARDLEKAGADAVVPEALEGSLQLAAQLLRSTGTPHDQVNDLLDSYRRNDYAKLALTVE